MPRLLVLIITLALLGGCQPELKERPARVTVVAPEYLAEPLGKVAEQFREETGVEVRYRFSDPDSVLSLVRAGTGGDLFLSHYPIKIRDTVEDTVFLGRHYRHLFILNLNLVRRPEGPEIDNPLRLKDDDIRRVVMLDPERNFAGKLAREALYRYRLWEALQNKLILARSPEQLYSYLHTDEADAGLVLALHLHDLPGTVRAGSLNEKIIPFLTVCGGIFATAENPKPARAFLDLFESPQCVFYDNEQAIRLTTAQ